MALKAPDRFTVPKVFWTGLAKLGLTPATVLRKARMPVTLYGSEKNFVTTAQFFALWKAVGELSSNPAAGLIIATNLDAATLPPSRFAASHARDYREALARTAHLTQLCSPEKMRIIESRQECQIELTWLYARDEEPPPLLVDAAFAYLLELGRHGVQQPLRAKRLELKRGPEQTGVHRDYFKCPVRFRARRNVLVLYANDLDRPFVTYNAELLEILDPQLSRELAERLSPSSICDQVKSIVKRMLAGRRPEIPAVARELGLSERTLQRRITEEGANFRQLLLQARQELVHQYLTHPDVQVAEVAYLLGYEDSNSFYRAFRTWEGTTPAHWRTTLTGKDNGRRISRASKIR
jgi:AraC-like DNA-binding protein